MEYKFGKDSIPISYGEVTNIVFGTTAEYADALYLAKKAKIRELEYECDLLVDKYHDEMKRAFIPFVFLENHLTGMFDKDKKNSLVKTARKLFLEKGFSSDFIKRHKIEFVTYARHGYNCTAVGLVLGIGDYEYTIQFPQPSHIRQEDKVRLMGDVKFRVDRIHKSKSKDFVKEMESVQMPTYDWKKCFEAIERIVEENNK